MSLKDLNTSLPESPLCLLGKKHQTEKPGNGYTRVYYEIMKDYVDLPIDFFEIGIFFGASMKMWYDFFPKGKIFGIDNGRLLPGSGAKLGQSNEFMSQDDIKLLADNSRVVYSKGFDWIENDRIKCKVSDQRSKFQLGEALDYFKCQEFDFILDDGQHFQEHQQRSLSLLFPKVKSGGYYIIEDVIPYHTLVMGQYWGQKKNCNDSTDLVFTLFIEGKELKSPWISDDEAKYITENIDDIFLYDYMNGEGSPINGTSKLLVIKKK